MKRFIIFDMDGTLYRLDAVLPAVYEIQVDFLKMKKGWTRDAAVSYFNDNCVYPVVAEKSRSATRLFQESGFDLREWNEFREARFPFDAVDVSPAVSEGLMEGFAKLGLCVLVTSNSRKNAEKILEKIDIRTSVFDRIVCNDSVSSGQPFCKMGIFKSLLDCYSASSQQAISIGDRYLTDIEPMLKLGGHGVLVSAPESLPAVLHDMSGGKLMTCDAYRYFSAANVSCNEGGAFG